MKLPRNVRLLHSPFEAAPFAAVFFLLIIFLLLGALLPTPGLRVKLPMADALPGTDQPTVFLAVDQYDRYFFANQIKTAAELAQSLHAATTRSPQALTLVINADERVTYAQLVRIIMLAREAGITNALLATRPDPSGPVAPRP